MKMPSLFACCFFVSALASVAQNSFIAGQYVLQEAGRDLGPIRKYIMNQPTVHGASILIIWSHVDQGAGQYDWSSVENQISPWSAIQKPVNLIVWGTGFTSNNATPMYVVEDPGYQSVTCYGESYPVYYNSVYKQSYQTFIKALLNRYGSDPRIGYIRVGLSRGGEAFPTCLAALIQLGGYTDLDQFNSVWESYIAEMTAVQQTVPHTAQLVTPVNQYGTLGQYEVPDWEAANAVTLGFGFGCQGLQLSDTISYPNSPCASDWCALFAGQPATVPRYLQTISASDPANVTGGVGSLTVLLPFALSLGAQALEIYVDDWQVAYDPTSPNYAKYGAAYRRVFAQTQAALGY